MATEADTFPECEARGDAKEEGIQVAIRMRPLNNKESDGVSVWRVLKKHNMIAQTTIDGKPLPDRCEGRNVFAFDKTFGTNANTQHVYDGVVKNIVLSVVGGLNGTVFAYGQTSSGKTFTFFGGQQNDPTSYGIIQMAANDIFSHVLADTTRSYLLKASFIEIYNEEVRDLLVCGNDGVGAALAVREDPRRGVFVNANETIISGLDSLMATLAAGEQNRSVGSTAMNERSSRSHTIFKITVESRKIKKNQSISINDTSSDFSDDEDSEHHKTLDYEDDAVLVSSLNLVDLAGSESVRHTGATGDRQKEGGKINQSLLTLSRVIVGLGTQGNNHINFRDSKLTRILQPSLSGNARMAIICCATPSELYLEETRSTLQFAARAKLVKTRAKVNEILDDRTLLKKIQKELAEAKRELALAQMRISDNKAERELISVKEQLREVLTQREYEAHAPKFGFPRTAASEQIDPKNLKRRRSDGIGTSHENFSDFPLSDKRIKGLCSDSRVCSEIPNLEQHRIEFLNLALNTTREQFMQLEKQLDSAKDEIFNLKSTQQASEARIAGLTSDHEFVHNEVRVMAEDNRKVLDGNKLHIEALSRENALLLQRVNELEEENKDLRFNLYPNKELFEGLKEKNQKHENELKIQNKLIKEQEEKLSILQSSKSSLEKALNTQVKITLQKDIIADELHKELLDVKEQKIALESRNSGLSEQIGILFGRIYELLSHKNEYKESNLSLSDQIEYLKDTISKQESSIKVLRTNQVSLDSDKLEIARDTELNFASDYTRALENENTALLQATDCILLDLKAKFEEISELVVSAQDAFAFHSTHTLFAETLDNMDNDHETSTYKHDEMNHVIYSRNHLLHVHSLMEDLKASSCLLHDMIDSNEIKERNRLIWAKMRYTQKSLGDLLSATKLRTTFLTDENVFAMKSHDVALDNFSDLIHPTIKQLSHGFKELMFLLSSLLNIFIRQNQEYDMQVDDALQDSFLEPYKTNIEHLESLLEHLQMLLHTFHVSNELKTKVCVDLCDDKVKNQKLLQRSQSYCRKSLEAQTSQIATMAKSADQLHDYVLNNIYPLRSSISDALSSFSSMSDEFNAVTNIFSSLIGFENMAEVRDINNNSVQFHDLTDFMAEIRRIVAYSGANKEEIPISYGPSPAPKKSSALSNLKSLLLQHDSVLDSNTNLRSSLNLANQKQEALCDELSSVFDLFEQNTYFLQAALVQSDHFLKNSSSKSPIEEILSKYQLQICEVLSSKSEASSLLKYVMQALHDFLPQQVGLESGSYKLVAIHPWDELNAVLNYIIESTPSGVLERDKLRELALILCKKLCETQDKVLDLEIDLNRVSEALQSSHIESNCLMSQCCDTVETLKASIEEKEQECQSLLKSLHKARVHSNELTNMLTQSRGNSEQLANELSNLKALHQKSIYDTNIEMTGLNEYCQELEQEIEIKTAKFSEANAKLENRDLKIITLFDELLGYKNRVKQIGTSLHTSLQRVDSLENEIEESHSLHEDVMKYCHLSLKELLICVHDLNNVIAYSQENNTLDCKWNNETGGPSDVFELEFIGTVNSLQDREMSNHMDMSILLDMFSELEDAVVLSQKAIDHLQNANSKLLINCEFNAAQCKVRADTICDFQNDIRALQMQSVFISKMASLIEKTAEALGSPHQSNCLFPQSEISISNTQTTKKVVIFDASKILSRATYECTSMKNEIEELSSICRQTEASSLSTSVNEKMRFLNSLLNTVMKYDEGSSSLIHEDVSFSQGLVTTFKSLLSIYKGCSETLKMYSQVAKTQEFFIKEGQGTAFYLQRAKVDQSNELRHFVLNLSASFRHLQELMSAKDHANENKSFLAKTNEMVSILCEQNTSLTQRLDTYVIQQESQRHEFIAYWNEFKSNLEVLIGSKTIVSQGLLDYQELLKDEFEKFAKLIESLIKETLLIDRLSLEKDALRTHLDAVMEQSTVSDTCFLESMNSIKEQVSNTNLQIEVISKNAVASADGFCTAVNNLLIEIEDLRENKLTADTQLEILKRENSQFRKECSIRIDELESSIHLTREASINLNYVLKERQNMCDRIQKELHAKKAKEMQLIAQEDLLQEMELLLEEKLQVQERLEKEIEYSSKLEEDLRYKMGEKQRLLENEAQEEMEALKIELCKVKCDLEISSKNEMKLQERLSESFLYLDNMNDLIDTAQRSLCEADQKFQDVSRSLAIVSQEKFLQAEAFDTLKEELDEIRVSANVSRNNMELEHVKSLAQLKAEIDVLRHEISEFMEQNQHLRNEALLLNDEMRHLKSQAFLEKERMGAAISENIKVLKQRISTFENQHEACKAEIQQMKIKCIESHERASHFEIEYKKATEHAALISLKFEKYKTDNLQNESCESCSLLKVQLIKYKEEIIGKDARIKKLDSVKLTKEKAMAMKKIKDERHQFSQENDNLKLKLEALQNEIMEYRQRNLESSCNREVVELKTENAELRKEKDQIFAKLRKYAAHIKQMDQERISAFQEMKKVCKDIETDDLSGSISFLCARVKEAEEDCDALINVETRASRYLVENDRLQKEIHHISERLLNLEASLKAKELSNLELKSALERVKEVQEKTLVELDQIRLSDAERKRRIRFLEQENLQLMTDIKYAKKQIFYQTRVDKTATSSGTLDDGDDSQSNCEVSPISEVVEEIDKENEGRKMIDNSPKQFTDLQKKNNGKSYQKTAFGESCSNEEATGECTQS